MNNGEHKKYEVISRVISSIEHTHGNLLNQMPCTVLFHHEHHASGDIALNSQVISAVGKHNGELITLLDLNTISLEGN